MKKLLILILLLFGCGQDKSDSPPVVSNCTTCFASLHNLNGQIGYMTVWQTTDGSHVDSCDFSSDGYSCDPSVYACEASKFAISTSSFWCE